VDLTEPPQTAERRLVLEDPLARLPRLDMAYKVPPSLTPDDDALGVLSTILAGGRSSRLFETIVRQRQLSPGISAGKGESRGPGLLRVVATLSPGQQMSALEAAVDGEIERVKTGTIAGWEMEKARSSARRTLVSSLQSSLQRAILLSQYAMFYNDPGLINTRADRIASVTAADVQRVARTYLTPQNRTVVVTNPKPAAGRGGL
jgi:zinc protease